MCSLILLYTLLRATQPSIRFYYKNSQGFILINQLSCKIRSKFNSYRISTILDVSESSFNLLQLSFTMFSQIRFRTVLKIPKHIQVMFSLWIWSEDVLFNSRFVITPILMSHTFSERSFRSLRLLCFEVFYKISFRGSKQ